MRNELHVEVSGDVEHSTLVTAGRDVYFLAGAEALAALRQPQLQDYLRILVIVAAPVTGPPGTNLVPVPLDARAEWQRLAEAVRRSGAPIALIRLTPPTPDALRRILGPGAQEQRLAPHVVHFIGHGEKGGLWLEDEQGRARLCSGDELLAAFRDSGVRLAVLNACHTATHDGLSMAQALAESGAVEAVVGHRQPVGDDAAVAFAATLYAELAAGFSLSDCFDRAVARLRREHPADADNPRSFGEGAWSLVTAGRGEPLIRDARPPGSLPTIAARFFGRGAELVGLAGHLGDANRRVAVITGVGGIGKSALAVEAAHRNGWRFPGGMTWVSAREMAEFSLEAALGVLARSLGLARQPGEDPGAALVAHCGREPTLLILDNLETAARQQPHELARLIGWLNSFSLEAGSKVLVTLRPPLPALEELPGVVPLGLTRGLDDKSGARYVLFLAQASPIKGLTGRMREALTLTRRLAGHPKMLEIAVGTARRRGYRSLQAMLPALSGDLATRLDELIGWSVEMLEAEGRRLLPYLPLFPAASFTRQAVLAAAGDEESHWAGAGLNQLVDSGLVDYRAAADRHELHQTVVEWINQRCPLGGAEVRAARLRLAGHYRGFVRENWQDYDALEVERENVLAGMEWAWGKVQSPEWAQAVVDYARSLERFWNVRGFWDIGEERLGWGLEAAQKSHSLGDEDFFCHCIAILRANRGDYDSARRLYQRSVEIDKEIDDQRGLAATLHQLAVIEADQGRYAAARALYQESREIHERLGDQRGLARTLGQLAKLEQAQGKYLEARKLYERIRDMFKSLGDQQGLATTLHQLAIIEAAQGRYAEARALYQQSREIKERLGDQRGLAATLHQLASIEAAQGRYAAAHALYQESREIHERLGDQRGLAATLHQLALLEKYQGRPEEARRLHQQSLEIAQRLGDQSWIGLNLHNLAALEADQGRYAEARDLYQESAEIERRLGNQRGLAATLHQLAGIEANQGRYAAARALYQESAEIERRLGNQRGLAYSLHALGVVAAQGGDLAAAREYLEQALSIRRRLGDLLNVAENLAALGQLHLSEGEAVEAVKVWREVLAIFEQLGIEQAEAARGWRVREWLEQAESAGG